MQPMTTWSHLWAEARKILIAVAGRALADLAWRAARAVAGHVTGMR